ncbi:hypothetical protein BC827DRAFT_1197209, partial [Russula dissimulans]
IPLFNMCSPNVGNVQGIHAQPQSDVPQNQQYLATFLAPGPALPPIPDRFAHGMPAPTPGQPEQEIFINSLVVSCAIPALLLIWPAWNRMRPVVVRM